MKTKAVSVLREHIDMHYEGSISRFAKAHRFDVSELARVLRGERGSRMSVKLGAAIEDATKGLEPTVTLRLWLLEEE